MNKLYSDLNGTNSQSETPQKGISPIKRMMNTVKFASDPNQAVADMINSNPNALQIINMLKNSGKTPKELFYELAKQKGVDPNEILKQLQ